MLAWVFVFAFGIFLASVAYADEVRYVWALQGLNLRDAASANAKVITRLNYGSAVELLPASGEHVPYEMAFFPTTAAQTIKPGTMPIISGEWIKVQAGRQQGYVFDKLLLPYSPIKKGENEEKYFARIFELTAKSSHGKRDKDGAELTVYGDPNAKNKAYIEIRDYPESSGSANSITIPNMPFEQAFIMVNALVPPDLSVAYTYRQGNAFEYQGRDACICRLNVQKNGVIFQWASEP